MHFTGDTFPWPALVILFAMMLVALVLAGISYDTRHASGCNTLEPIVMTFWMTGYTQEEGFDENTTTSNGTIPSYGTVAIDPSVLPFGSIIYWQEYSDTTPGNHYGIALDTGSAVKGNHLDWWYETNWDAARMTKTATVKILRWGWNEYTCDPADWGLTP